MEFHEKLQELRKQKNLTQEELAQALYVSRTAVSKWESARGYPNIDSLKAIAKFFGVTVDELLSGEELLTIAQADAKQSRNNTRDLLYGLLDCSVAMFLFLPLFGQKTEGAVQACSLLALTGVAPWLRFAYFAVVTGMALWGVLMLAMQNCRRAFWEKGKSKISLALGGLGVLLLIISRQVYGAALLFLFFLIKVLVLIKKP